MSGGVKRLMSMARVCASWYCSFLSFQPATYSCHCAPCYVCGCGEEIVFKNWKERGSGVGSWYFRGLLEWGNLKWEIHCQVDLHKAVK